jgi:hypothetical protein
MTALAAKGQSTGAPAWVTTYDLYWSSMFARSSFRLANENHTRARVPSTMATRIHNRDIILAGVPVVALFFAAHVATAQTDPVTRPAARHRQ